MWWVGRAKCVPPLTAGTPLKQMFHLRVEEVSDRKMSELVPAEDNDNDFMEVFREPLDRECVEFSVGNPRVEHITGIVHLYKRNSTAAPYGSKEPWQGAKGQSIAAEVGRPAWACAGVVCWHGPMITSSATPNLHCLEQACRNAVCMYACTPATGKL